MLATGKWPMAQIPCPAVPIAIGSCGFSHVASRLASRRCDASHVGHVRPLAPLCLGWRRPYRHDRPALGRSGRGQADRGLEGGGQVHRRERAGHSAVAICAADPARAGSGGDTARIGRAAAASDEAGLSGRFLWKGRGVSHPPQPPRDTCGQKKLGCVGSVLTFSNKKKFR